MVITVSEIVHGYAIAEDRALIPVIVVSDSFRQIFEHRLVEPCFILEIIPSFNAYIRIDFAFSDHEIFRNYFFTGIVLSRSNTRYHSVCAWLNRFGFRITTIDILFLIFECDFTLF